MGDPLHDIYEVTNVPVPNDSKTLIEQRIDLPRVRVGAPGDVLVLRRDHDAPFSLSSCTICGGSRVRPSSSTQSYRPVPELLCPPLEEGQVAQHVAVRALDEQREGKRDVLRGSEADVLDGEVYGGRFS